MKGKNALAIVLVILMVLILASAHPRMDTPPEPVLKRTR